MSWTVHWGHDVTDTNGAASTAETHLGSITLLLPDAWTVGSGADIVGELSSVEPQTDEHAQLLEDLIAEARTTIRRSADEGLALLGGFSELVTDDEPPTATDDGLTQDGRIATDAVPSTHIGASVGVFLRPRPSGGEDALKNALSSTEGRWIAQHEEVELPCGTAAVTRELTSGGHGVLTTTVDSLLVTYYVLPKTIERLLVIVLFQTPSLAFAKEFDEQFAAIAQTIEVAPDVEPVGSPG